METQSQSLFEQFLAPLFGSLIDKEALLRLRNSIDWEAEMAAIAHPQVTYPDYYQTSQFHGVKNGYLNIDAAITYDPITQYVLPPSETWVRESLVHAIQGSPRRILDLGCGTGTTTLMLKRRFPQAKVVGLDLSPQMLIMAQRKAQAAGLDITFRHGDAMQTGLDATSFDAVCATLLFHETPPTVAKAVLRESFRLLRPGGQMLVLDGNQATLRQLDWLSNIFEEPFIREYRQGNLDAWLGYAGFTTVRTQNVFMLNQLSTARKPLPVTDPATTANQWVVPQEADGGPVPVPTA
ncbi:class I SAM-dependent methyltransferase [Leptolyngbya iicbica]|uniref:Class I SAM-dependent methyltransferase n=2 Tax=Cyanophyceae TaxID=3028117 RepID=A0A4Q7E2P2_9CYAN|nr:class I SAM-dependent methyltransferase [Leptolyngbya sp. LK]RZM76077.1 class I SAM-dependent methyltransferase [Leptolyngbya sp. LK]